MRAAVVGVNWGRVHVAALRDAGAEVVAVVARERDNAVRAAEELGVPVALDDPVALHGLGLGFVCVATPAHTHRDVVAALPDVPVICEKPAVGASPVVDVPPRRAPVWVNYAFAHLRTAVVAAESLDGPVSARVVSAHDLPHLTDGEALYELLTHPWSWVVAMLGRPAVAGRGVECGGVPVQLRVERHPGLTGIRHEVELVDARGTIHVTGRYRVGDDWAFEARRNGTALAAPEIGPPDPWYTANARSIAAALRGEDDPWSFDWDRALALDRCAQQLTARR